VSIPRIPIPASIFEATPHRITAVSVPALPRAVDFALPRFHNISPIFDL
jgi:hypothetical protein